MVDGATLGLSLVGVVTVVFGLFNMENGIDLTDRGRELSKQKRINDRRENGILPRAVDPNADPYRYRIPFLDDDEEVDISIINGGKKKTGGCG